jgi:hypothetical protein
MSRRVVPDVKYVILNDDCEKLKSCSTWILLSVLGGHSLGKEASTAQPSAAAVSDKKANTSAASQACICRVSARRRHF